MDRLNHADDALAAELLLPFIERAPQVAELVAQHRPFASPDAIARSIQTAIQTLPEDDLFSLFRAHPELAPPTPETMTRASQEEQGRLGLDAPDAALTARFTQLNTEYQTRFGFPFILALHRMSGVSEVLQVFEDRLKRTRDAEIKQAVAEIASVSAARVTKAFGEAGHR
nr:2-oxo-4-hydroxy-4-carboxy-5-ureidoimidazoline decarboxylase [Epibacterium ulvae]